MKWFSSGLCMKMRFTPDNRAGGLGQSDVALPVRSRRGAGRFLGFGAESAAPSPRNENRGSDLTTLICGRRSVRRFLERPVPAETVARVLEAARWAPSAHNRQPWRFLIVEEPERKTRLAAAMGERLAFDRIASGDSAGDIERDVARSRTRITLSPLLILVCMTLEDMDRYPDRRRSDAERIMAVQSTAMSVQNMLLAAAAEGLGACWMCAPLFCPDVVTGAFDLPPRWEPQALISIGYQEGEGRERPRRPLSELALGWKRS